MKSFLFLIPKVCTKWRFFIDEVKPTELLLNKSGGPLFHGNWYRTEHKLNLRNSIIIRTFEDISNFPFSLQNLKRLYINFWINVNPNFLSTLSSLSKLKHLEIIYLDIQEQKSTLTLPSVKTLHICELFVNGTDRSDEIDYPAKLVINAPKMKKLRNSIGFAQLHIQHPETVEDLEIYGPYNVFWKSFGNVQYFNCDACSDLDDCEILSMFPVINEIRLDQKFIIDIEECDTAENFMNRLVEQRSIMSKEHVKIYFGETEMVGNGKFADYGFDLPVKFLEQNAA